MTKTIYDLFQTCNVDEVILQISRLYPEEKRSLEGYYKAFQDIKSLMPVSGKDELICVVEMREDDFEKNGEFYADVNGYSEKDQETYALDMTPWSEWLAMPFRRGKGCEEISDEELLAHIHWEMTWYGFTQGAIQKARDQLDESIKELDEGKAKTVPVDLDEFFKDI